MNYSVIVGVDISKSTLDVCLLPAAQQFTIANNSKGFQALLKALRALGQPHDQVLVVMEHTGYYSFRLECFLCEQAIGYCKVPALQIIRSAGINRQKSDRADARQIARYGWQHRDCLQADGQLCSTLQELRQLLTLRFQLVKSRSGYLCSLKELKAAGVIEDTSYTAQSRQRIINALTIGIAAVEAKIKACIQSNEALQINYALLRSIKGIGPVIAAYILARTENFRRFKNARKFNCYAGLAPFKHESGGSIKGRERISHLANKKCKELLTQAANVAVRHDPELNHYYQQRLQKGKSKKNALNVIRAKLVARMFAVINRQTAYQLLPKAA